MCGPGHSGQNSSVSYLQKPWPTASPGYVRHVCDNVWVRSLNPSPTSEALNHLCYLSAKEWYEMEKYIYVSFKKNQHFGSVRHELIHVNVILT